MTTRGVVAFNIAKPGQGSVRRCKPGKVEAYAPGTKHARPICIGVYTFEHQARRAIAEWIAKQAEQPEGDL